MDSARRRLPQPRRCLQRLAALGCAVLTLSACDKIIGAHFNDLQPFPSEAGAADARSDEGLRVPPSDASAEALADVNVDPADTTDAALDDGSTQIEDVVDAKRDVLVEVGTAPDGESGRRDARADAPDAGAVDAQADVEMDATERDGAPDGDARIAGPVLFNELNAQGTVDDYIELHNVSAEPFDLSGYAVSQAGGSFGAPNLISRLIFPAGTMLDAGAHLLIVAGQPPPRGQVATCPISLPNAGGCWVVEWGIAKAGERVYLLAPDTRVVDTADFPTVESGQQPPTGRSLGRFPDGTGPFQSTAYSPGGANHVL